MSEILAQEVKNLLEENIVNVVFLNEYPTTQGKRVLESPCAVIGIVEEEYILENHIKLSIDLYIPINEGGKKAGEIFSQICTVLKENMNDITGISRMKIRTDEAVAAICLPCTISVENMQNTLTVNAEEIQAKSVEIVYLQPKTIHPIGAKNAVVASKSKISIVINLPRPYLFDEDGIYEIVFAGTKYINCRLINAQFNLQGKCIKAQLEGVRE